MKFSCLKEKLDKSLSTAERFCGKNVALPILSSILLEAGENLALITATNLEYAIQISVPCSIKEKGKVCVPGKVISSFVQSIKDDQVDFEEKNNNLFIKTETRKTQINGLPTDEFPLIPKIKKNFSFKVESSVLCKGIESVIPAVSLSEFKPELRGIFFKVNPDSIHLASTDTFRLAEKKIPFLKREASDTFSFILPAKVSYEVMRSFDGGENIDVSVDDNQILFESQTIKLVSRLIDGKFPEYIGIIPNNFKSTCYLNKNETRDAIRASSIFSSKLRDVTLKFTGSHIEVTSINQEVGEYSNRINTELTGEEIIMSFNFRYLLDGLNVVQDDEVFFGCNSDNNPALIRNKNDNSFLYVIMPIKTGI